MHVHEITAALSGRRLEPATEVAEVIDGMRYALRLVTRDSNEHSTYHCCVACLVMT